MKRISFVMAVSVLLAVSCSKDLTGDGSSKDFQLEKGDYTFLKSADAYEQAKVERSSDYSDDFEIKSVVRMGDTLNISVSYFEGCESNKFEVIWNGAIMESYPEMTIFFVKRTADNCGSKGVLKTQLLSIVLTELIEDKALAKRISITVANASKTAKTENANISVSSNK